MNTLEFPSERECVCHVINCVHAFGCCSPTNPFIVIIKLVAYFILLCQHCLAKKKQAYLKKNTDTQLTLALLFYIKIDVDIIFVNAKTKNLFRAIFYPKNTNTVHTLTWSP